VYPSPLGTNRFGTRRGPAPLVRRSSPHAVLRAAAGRGVLARVRRGEVLPTPSAVLFDRDGTLVHDVPYNGDPAKVDPVATARPALARLRHAGIAVGVVSNQSGVARGLLTEQDVVAVNARLDALVGPIGVWAWCPHGEADGCPCRKPAPGLVLDAARRLGVDPAACAVVGDISADLGAARAAGAVGVLVPTPATRPEEVAAARLVATDLLDALDLLGIPG
jgi:D-glycero-D-manno-heptose 1,7-bisphosphate phosphatase